MNDIICLHHNDFDGRFAAFIVGQYAKAMKVNIEYMAYNYDGISDYSFFENKDVVMVDLTLKQDEMNKLIDIIGCEHLTWIDHHTNNIKAIKIENINGYRSDTNPSGCLLTCYFYEEYCTSYMKKICESVSDFDAWQWKLPNTKEFVYGLDCYDTNPTSNDMKKIMSGEIDFKEICNKGLVAMEYSKNKNKEYFEQYSFETKFENYNCIACNKAYAHSDFYDTALDKYDIAISFVFNGEFYKYSLYSRKENINCAEIATRYGGGGHKRASGFNHNKLLIGK